MRTFKTTQENRHCCKDGHTNPEFAFWCGIKQFEGSLDVHEIVKGMVTAPCGSTLIPVILPANDRQAKPRIGFRAAYHLHQFDPEILYNSAHHRERVLAGRISVMRPVALA